MSAFALGRRHRWASCASLGTGLLLVVWLAIQTAIMGYQLPSQLFWWALFPAVVVLGWVLVRRDRAGR